MHLHLSRWMFHEDKTPKCIKKTQVYYKKKNQHKNHLEPTCLQVRFLIYNLKKRGSAFKVFTMST